MRINYTVMNKKRGTSVVVLALLVLGFFTFSIANANTNRVSYDDDERKKSSFWVWERFRRAYSMYTSIFPTTSVGQYWQMVKLILNNTYAYFFPPNIDFRKGGEAQAVSEAFSESIGRSKATLEEVAKSAAEKVKRSLSSDGKEKKEL